jgi:hypothetical protein
MAIHGALPRSATIHDDPFESIFRKALSEISARYSPGALRYGERRFPQLKREIKEIEGTLNQMWRSGQRDKSEKDRLKKNLREFRDVLKRWYYLNLRVIESCRSRRKQV